MKSLSCDSLRPHGLQPPRLLLPWDLPGKSTGVGCHFLLQGIFPTQGLNLDLLHCRQSLYHLGHLESPREQCSILLSSSQGMNQLRDARIKKWSEF